MAIFDFLTGTQDNLPQYGNIAAELQAPQPYSNGGELAVQQLRPTLFNRITGLGDKIYDGLFGKIVDNSGVNDGTLSATINNPHREGGVISDLQNGFNENLNTRFVPQNIVGNGGSFARKIGEGLGTVARIADSPLGRGIIAYGLSKHIGDNNPLEQALTAMGTNQQLRTADRLYRNGLEEQGYDTSGLNGYINKDLYNNISLNNYRNSRINQQLQIAQMRDNTSRAKMITDWLQKGMLTPQEASSLISMYGITDADFQKSNATRMTDIREEKAPYEIENLEARTENIKNPAPKKVIHVSEGKGGKKDGKPIGTSGGSNHKTNAF